MTEPLLHIFLIAGEPSGDLLGARLMHALKHRSPVPVRFSGIGGERMRAEGLEQLFPLDDLAVMGLAEVLPRLPTLLRRMDQAVEAVKAQKPDALITIDAPDFSFRVAKRLKGQGPKLIHYVAPTVWAWRPGRARKVARFLDHLLALFPFEPPYFEREGLGCTFVGHPLVESGAGKGDADAFRSRYPETSGKRLLTVLPGSRRGEVTRLLPVFGATLNRLVQKHPNLMVIVPTVSNVEAQAQEAVKFWSVPALIVRGDQDKYDAFAASDVALAASGTIALELALAGLPAVIAYKVNTLSAFLFRKLANIKYANLVNIMHDRMVVPELLQENCRPDVLADAVDTLLSDTESHKTQKAALAQVASWLGKGDQPPSERAADTVLEVLGKGRNDSERHQ